MKREIGATTEKTYTITREAVLAFNDSVGYPTDTSQHRVMARSMYAANLLTRLLDEEVAGRLVFLSQSIKFHHPVYEGDVITVSIDVVYAYDSDLQIAFKAVNADSTLIITGEADIQVFVENAGEPAEG